MEPQTSSLIAQQYYEQVALESGDFYMLEIANAFMPTKKKLKTRAPTQKHSPTMSSIQSQLELIQQRVDNVKKQFKS